jgi:hypothetical protein
VSQDGHHKRRVFQLSTKDSSITFHRFLVEPDIGMSFQKGNWYHIAVTYEDRIFRLYRNGVLVNSQEGNLSTTSEEPIFIGRKSTDEPYFFFHGKIDDLRIYNRALSADEVNELHTENGWKSVKEPKSIEVEKEDLPLLECIDDIQMAVANKYIRDAAEWYISHLGFKLLMEDIKSFTC